MHLIAIQRGLWVAGLSAEVLLLGALLRRGLIRRYPFFFLYIAADLIWGLVLIQIDYRSHAYSLGYRLYLMTICVLRLGMAAELYERICEHFRGIGKFRIYMAAVLSALGALFALSTFLSGADWGFPESVFVVLVRFESTVLFALLLLTRFVLHHFLKIRPPMRANVLNHWALLIAYFGISAAANAAVHVTRPNVVGINVAMLAGDVLCLIAWTRLLTSAGEAVPRVYEWSPEGQARKDELRRALLDLVERAGNEMLHRR